ncbi:hypothetical protein [uncultured Fibrella sp.]|uniref:hypothetical protein n=1 Tax=uncultured Fibrella sp. TaxID=1284596 RepID=UPI0035C94364
MSKLSISEGSYINLKYITTYNDLGIIESSLKNLKHIVIFTDYVEEPQEGLREAVKNNIQKGIKYTFIVSESNFESERDKYLSFFYKILPKVEVDANLNIYGFNFEWNPPKCIFYELDHDPEDIEIHVLGYWGLGKENGVTINYAYIPDEQVANIVQIALKGVNRGDAVFNVIKNLNSATTYATKELENNRSLLAS